MIFYYKKEFPGVVIGEPQSILNKHTEVVAYHIELTTNPKMQKGLHGIWKKFKECGILSVECSRPHYVEGKPEVAFNTNSLATTQPLSPKQARSCCAARTGTWAFQSNHSTECGYKVSL